MAQTPMRDHVGEKHEYDREIHEPEAVAPGQADDPRARSSFTDGSRGPSRAVHPLPEYRRSQAREVTYEGCAGVASRSPSVARLGGGTAQPLSVPREKAMKTSQLVRACVIIVACSIVSTAQA